MKTFEMPYKPYKSFIVNNMIIMEKFFFNHHHIGGGGRCTFWRPERTHPPPPPSEKTQIGPGFALHNTLNEKGPLMLLWFLPEWGALARMEWHGLLWWDDVLIGGIGGILNGHNSPLQTKSIRFIDKRHMAFRHVEKPYRPCRKWRLLRGLISLISPLLLIIW